jgi:hypothetical protein
MSNVFEFIPVEGSATIMKHFKGTQAMKVWESLGCKKSAP